MNAYVFIFIVCSVVSLHAMEEGSIEANTEVEGRIINALNEYNNDNLQAINSNRKWFMTTYGFGLFLLLWSAIDIGLGLTSFSPVTFGGAIGILGGSIGSQKNTSKILKNLEHCKDIIVHKNPVSSLIQPPSASWFTARWPM